MDCMSQMQETLKEKQMTDKKRKETNIETAQSLEQEFLQSLSLQESLGMIQMELKAPKNQYNSFGGYNYRSCEDILEAVKPLLAKYYCVLSISDEIGAIGEPPRWYVKAVVTISKGNESLNVSAFARESESKKGMDAAQITGAASSYARKYALNGLFLIDDTKDPDATNDHGKGKKDPPPKPPLNLDKVKSKEGRAWITKRESPEVAISKFKDSYEVDEVGEALITDIWHAENSDDNS